MNPNGTGIAVALDRLGKIIDELESDNSFMRYRIEEYEKQIAELKKENEKMSSEWFKRLTEETLEKGCSNG